MKKPRPTTCCVAGCCQPVYSTPSNPYFKHCYPHLLERKNEQRRRRKQGLDNGKPGWQHVRTEVPDDGGYQPRKAAGLKAPNTPGFGL